MLEISLVCYHIICLQLRGRTGPVKHKGYGWIREDMIFMSALSILCLHELPHCEQYQRLLGFDFVVALLGLLLLYFHHSSYCPVLMNVSLRHICTLKRCTLVEMPDYGRCVVFVYFYVSTAYSQPGMGVLITSGFVLRASQSV